MEMAADCYGGAKMNRFLSNRLSLLVFSVLGSAFVLAEGGVPEPPATETPFSFGTFRKIAREQTACVVHIVSDWSGSGMAAVVEDEPAEAELPGQGIGSGVILSRDGLILTNDHVVAGSDTVRVTLHDGTPLKAEVVGRDAELDVALLRVEPPRPLQPAVLGDSRRVQVGDWVLAIGSPYGLASSVSVGIVSALGRDLQSGNYDDFIQTDAPIHVGNSGGPLFDIRGQVIGVNTAILTSGGASSGIGFAIPIHDLMPVVEQLRSNGRVTRGWLGVALEDMSPQRIEELGLPAGAGAVVTDVWPNSPAARAGLRVGDVIEAFGTKKIGPMRALLFAVAETPIGSRVRIEVLRGGRRLALEVRVGSRPQETEAAPGGATAAGPDPDAPALRGASSVGIVPARRSTCR
jgi:serine protease Do